MNKTFLLFAVTAVFLVSATGILLMSKQTPSELSATQNCASIKPSGDTYTLTNICSTNAILVGKMESVSWTFTSECLKPNESAYWGIYATGRPVSAYSIPC